MQATATTTSSPAPLQKAFQEVARQLDDLGLNLVLEGPSRRAVLKGSSACEACGRLCAGPGPLQDARRSLAESVWADGKPRHALGEAGCVLLAAPVKQRRRIVAVGVACGFTPAAERSEGFARLCDRLRLDRAYLASAIADRPRHAADRAPGLLTFLQWLLGQQLDSAIAQNELVTLSTNLASTYEELNLLYRLSGAMKVDIQPEEFFNNVCAELREVMGMAAAVVIVNDRLHPQQSDRIIRSGTIDLDDEALRSLVARHVAPLLLVSPSGTMENNLHEPSDLEGDLNDARASGGRPGWATTVRSFLAVPLTIGETTQGLLLGLNKLEGDFNSIDQKLLTSVGSQSASFLANHHLYDELQELLMGVLHVLTASIDAKDPYTRGHSQRVALVSRKLAELCGFEPPRVRSIYLGGLLHDIGKIGVSEAVLCKQGRLTEKEFESMRRHPGVGARILSNIRQMREILPGVLCHHERPDGRGYPQGLSGDRVPIEGLIVGLADCFDAMTSSRTYRRAMPLETVVAEILRFSGTQFDPRLVDHLLGLELPAFLAELRESEPGGGDPGDVNHPWEDPAAAGGAVPAREA